MYIENVLPFPVDFHGDVRTLIVGLRHQCSNDWEGVLDSLNENSELYLVREPDNPKDDIAIAAYLGDRRIGYVSAEDNHKIWLYLTNEKIRCTFLQRYEASFKVSFENPRGQFEGIPFKDIYKDVDGETERALPTFEIPFITNPKDPNFEWTFDKILIPDLEDVIPDFRRKLATRMIIFVGRKNSEGLYKYYFPYNNRPVVRIEDDFIKDLIDKYGFVIGIPDVPTYTCQHVIVSDLHITFLEGVNFWSFNSEHQSEFVFSLTNKPIGTHEDDTATTLQEDKENDYSEHTKSIVIEHYFNIKNSSVGEVIKLRNLLKQIIKNKTVPCLARKQAGKINVYLEDGKPFYTIPADEHPEKLDEILRKENILFGEISPSTETSLNIRFYYDYVSGNHIEIEMLKLWSRDFYASMFDVTVPKARYVGKKSKADELEGKVVNIEFPCYEDDNYDYFDFDKSDYIHREYHEEIIKVTDEHKKDLYHNVPFVVLCRQNPVAPSLYEMCLPDESMFGIIGDEEPWEIRLREWIDEAGVIPATVQSYKKSIIDSLDLQYRAFKRKSRNQEIEDFVSSHFINDIDDFEIDDDTYRKIVEIIDPRRDGSMTNALTVAAIIPNWASQAGYYILSDEAPIWLGPSMNADILDQVHQNEKALGRVISYRNNHNGTYHFELKFHIEK